MLSSQRTIIHIDLDAFFASVEELLDPTLCGLPLVVGGSPEGRGVVCSASYAARRYGVRSAMPVSQALRLCPRAIVLPTRHHVYGQYSRQVMDVLRAITPDVEQISVDEAFLAVTGCERLFGPPQEIAIKVKGDVLAQTGLPCSVGVASNKLVAKIACSSGKPDGLVLVPTGAEAEFLSSMPIEALWGVGQATGTALRDMGVETIGQLALVGLEHLTRRFGENGKGLYWGARGVDHSAVQVSRERRSISHEMTFAEDVGDRVRLKRHLLNMSERLASQLRQKHLVAQTVRIKLRFPDLSTISRQVTLNQATDQTQPIYAHACELLDQNLFPRRRLRLLGLAASGLLQDAGYQLRLLERDDAQRIKLEQALDEIRGRYGHQSITRASLISLQGDAQQVKDEN